MGKEEKRRQYIIAQANQAIRPIGLQMGDYVGATDKAMVGRLIFQDKHYRLMSLMRTFDDDYLGRIVACGRGETEDPKGGTRLCDLSFAPPAMTGSGVGILHYLASIAIQAALVDIIWAHLQKAKEEATRPALLVADDRVRCGRMLEEADHFMAHCKSDIGGHWYHHLIEVRTLSVTVGCMFNLSSREIKARIEQLKVRTASWVPTEREITIVLEVVEDTGSSKKKGAVLFTCICGPRLSVQERVG